MKKMSDFFSVKPKKPSATASTTEVQLESEATPRAAASTDRQKKVRRTLEGTVTSSRRTEGGTNSDAVGNHHGDIELARRKVSTAEETKLKRGGQACVGLLHVPFQPAHVSLLRSHLYVACFA